MRRAQGLGLTGCCRVAALIAVLTIALSSVELRPPMPASAVEPDICFGDEDLLIAATSSVQHRGVWLQGTARPTLLRERVGMKGFVWDYVITPRVDGSYQSRFCVDSVIQCAEAAIAVGPSVG